MLLYIPYAGWPLVMQMENGDAVDPATPGALRARILDAGKKGRFSVMEMDWRGSRFRCGDSSSWYYGKYARVVANVECRQLPAQLPAARDQLQVYSYAFWFGFSNGEWRM